MGLERGGGGSHSYFEQLALLCGKAYVRVSVVRACTVPFRKEWRPIDGQTALRGSAIKRPRCMYDGGAITLKNALVLRSFGVPTMQNY